MPSELQRILECVFGFRKILGFQKFIYMKKPFKNLVITNKNPFGACFYDTYGNRTSNFTITGKQLLKIEKILNE